MESKNPRIHYQAVRAAGNWELDAAWPHVSELAASEDTEKHLRLVAIDALSGISPEKAEEFLGDLLDHEDEEIADAAYDAITMARAASEIGIEPEFDEDDIPC